MARAATHCIHHQSLEVTFDSPARQSGLQDRVAQVYYDQIVPRIADLFDELDTGRWSIPQLTIDCGTLDEANWEQELADAIIAGLRDEIGGVLHKAPALADKLPQRWADELIYFLKQGRWQWDTDVTSCSHLEQLFHWDTATLQTLLDTLCTNDDAVDRFLFYFSADFAERLADALLTRIAPNERDYLAHIGAAGIPIGRLSPYIIKTYVRYGQPLRAPESFSVSVMESIWPELSREAKARIVEHFVMPEIKAQQAAIIANNEKEGAVPQDRQRFFRAFCLLIKAEFPDSAALLQHHQDSALESSAVSGSQHPKQPLQTSDNENKVIPADGENLITGMEAPTDDDEAHVWYIQHAGLVLVYPFLTPFFQHIGFMDHDGQWQPTYQRLAPVLLHRLVYGPLAAQEVAENELALNKVLCGLSPMAFVDPTDTEYTLVMQQAVNELLTALIGHWNVLRNTSVEGLQETFLQREGKLAMQDDKWLLHVESRGVDVLLSSLPWSIGVIKLPWMDRMLHVEWIG